MNYGEVLAEAEAMQARWREQEERREREQAEFQAAMSLAAMVAQQEAERRHAALLYLMFNPAPTPETFGAILGVDVTCSSCKGQCTAGDACHLPDPTPAPRAPRIRMFQPSYDVAGPFRAPPGRLRRLLRALLSPFTNR